MGTGTSKQLKDQDAAGIRTNTDILDSKLGANREAIAYKHTEAALRGTLEIEKGMEASSLSVGTAEQEAFLRGLKGGKSAEEQAKLKAAEKAKAEKEAAARKRPGYGRRTPVKAKENKLPPKVLTWQEKVKLAKLNTARQVAVWQALKTKEADEHAMMINGLPFIILRAMGDEICEKFKKASMRILMAKKAVATAHGDVENKQIELSEAESKAEAAKNAPKPTGRRASQAQLDRTASRKSLGNQEKGGKLKPIEPEVPPEERLMKEIQEGKVVLDAAYVKLASETKDVIGLMKAYASQANSSDLEEKEWTSPRVMDAKVFSRSEDGKMFREKVKRILEKGQLCVLIFAASRGIKVHTNDTKIPMWNTDPWNLVDTFGTAPSGEAGASRINNMTFGARMLTQLVAKVREMAGDEAVLKMKVVIVASSANAQSIAIDLQERRFYGLNPMHVVMMEQPYIPGFEFEPLSQEYHACSGSSGDPKPFGTGYAMEQLAFTNQGYLVNDKNEDDPHLPLAESVLDYMQHLGVQWMTINMMNDLYRYGEMVIDVDMLAMTLNLREHTKCHMSMEVELVDSVGEARNQGSVCLRCTTNSGPNPEAYCEELEWDSFASPKLQTMLMSLKKENNNKLATCSDRYVVFLPQTNTMLKASNQGTLFTPCLKVNDAGLLYPVFDIADLTGHLRCVAVSSSAPVGELRTTSDLTQMIRNIQIQDKHELFIQETQNLPQSKLNQVTLNSSGVSVRFTVMLAVSDNTSSHSAFKLLQPLMKRGLDSLHLVHFIKSMNEMSKATKMLDSFLPDDLFINVTRSVLVLDGGANEMKFEIDSHARRIRADMVVIGTNALGMGKEKPGSLTMRFLKAGVVTTTLFVNEEWQKEDAWSEVDAACCLTLASNPMVDMLLKLLRPSVDSINLIRMTQSEQGDTTDSTLLKQNEEKFRKAGIQVWRHMKSGKMSKSVKEVVDEASVELLALQMPDGMGMPLDVKELFLSVKCSLILFKTPQQERRESDDVTEL